MGKYLKGDVVPCGGEWCEFMVMLTDHEWRHVDTHGHELGHEPIPRRNRTGPYRLANGDWSDGVDRTHVIPSHEFSKANPNRVYVHATYDLDTLGKWQPLYDVWHGDAMLECELSFAEAIAYADRMARGTE